MYLSTAVASAVVRSKAVASSVVVDSLLIVDPSVCLVLVLLCST